VSTSADTTQQRERIVKHVAVRFETEKDAVKFIRRPNQSYNDAIFPGVILRTTQKSVMGILNRGAHDYVLMIDAVHRTAHNDIVHLRTLRDSDVPEGETEVTPSMEIKITAEGISFIDL